MATDRQIRANRANAKKSTGPRTGPGKAVVSKNALKHGLLSSVPLIPGEDPEEYQNFRQGLRGDLEPVGAVEEMLVDQMSSNRWRFRRLMAIESGVFANQLYSIEEQRAEAEALQHKVFDLDLPELSHIDDAQAYARAMVRAEEAGAKRAHEIPTLGAAFVADQTTFAVLSRYAAMLDKQFFRAFHELQRVQHARGREGTEPARLIDVNVDLGGRG